MSQWRCRQCGAVRAVPHRFRVAGDGMLVKVFAKPCKRCGSTEEPSCDYDPWLDTDEDSAVPVAEGEEG